jgi:hypothetical protein
MGRRNKRQAGDARRSQHTQIREGIVLPGGNRNALQRVQVLLDRRERKGRPVQPGAFQRVAQHLPFPTHP